MSKKPVVLMVLDGYGLSDKTEGNAVALAKTPVMDKLMATAPFVQGAASGLPVGLPDGQMGNSSAQAVSYIRSLQESQRQSLMEIFLRTRRCLLQ